jgi:hypothetical protein
MNKRRWGKAVLHAGGLEHEEAAARAVNAEPWEPMPGMVKLQCARCAYWFAAANSAPYCPDCVIRQQRPPETT